MLRFRLLSTVALAGLVMVLSAHPLWAGEYTTEAIPAAAPEVRHVWRTTIDGIPISLSNTSRGGLVVPLVAQGQTCGTAQLVLASGRVIELGPMAGCQVNVFPQLDKFINRDGTQLRLEVNGQVRAVTLDESDKIGLAQVANQSRDSFLLFQQELARVVAQIRTPTPAAVPSPVAATVTPAPAIPAANTPPTPAPPVAPPVAVVQPSVPAPPTPGVQPPPSANPGSSQDFVIVGQIKEERSGAGSLLSVQAINRSTRTILTAQAKFDFYRNNQLVDTRIAAFNPSDVPSGSQATAQVSKADNNWDRVTVSFLWQR
ncbi:MAG: hypothetical protein OHK0012_07260 [Synechococcales cyanobacterium]